MPRPSHLPERLVTPRLILRRWVPADLEPFAAMNADPRVMEFFQKCATRDESDALAGRIQTHFDEKGYGLWAVEVPGVASFIGFIGLATPPFEAHFTPCVEIGWRLAAEFWGRGYAPEGAAACLRFAFEELRLPEVLSMTAVINHKSIRVMEKIGMTTTPVDDFDHPLVPAGHRLRRHVLYRAKPGLG